MQASSPVNISTRRAVIDDAPALCALATHVYLDTYATDGISRDMALDVQSAHSLQATEARLNDKYIEIIVAQAGEYLVGFVSLLKLSQCPVPHIKGPQILTLYVHPRFHQQGIGHQLIGLAEKLAAHHASNDVAIDHAVWLKAWVGNTAAKAFYLRQGYEDVGTTYYLTAQNKFENRVFAKSLNKPT